MKLKSGTRKVQAVMYRMQVQLILSMSRRLYDSSIMHDMEKRKTVVYSTSHSTRDGASICPPLNPSNNKACYFDDFFVLGTDVRFFFLFLFSFF